MPAPNASADAKDAAATAEVQHFEWQADPANFALNDA